MTLEQTVKYMKSPDYKERFIAEYWQLKIRYERLKELNDKIEASERLSNPALAPTITCDRCTLHEQQSVMGRYLHLLEVRAIMEEIDLEVK